MRDFRKQRSGSHDISRFLLLCTGVLVVLVLAVFALHAAWDMYTKFVVASRGNDAAQKELADLQNQYTRVSAAVGDLSTARGEEGEIRERFGVALPGEGAIQIVRNSTSSEAATAPQENIFSKIFQALFVW